MVSVSSPLGAQKPLMLPYTTSSPSPEASGSFCTWRYFLPNKPTTQTLVICPLTFMLVCYLWKFYHFTHISRSLKSIKFKTPFLSTPRGSWADVFRGDLGLSLYLGTLVFRSDCTIWGAFVTIHAKGPTCPTFVVCTKEPIGPSSPGASRGNLWSAHTVFTEGSDVQLLLVVS